MTRPFLALDWGTTNLRAWVVDEDGAVLCRQEFPLGIGRLQPGDAVARFHDTVRPALQAQGMPALLCGMVGSAIGWQVVPYLDCPADLESLKGALHQVADDVWIVPGLRAQRPDGGPDVMRGEECQLLGWAAERPDRRSGELLVCLPGTHAKWVRMVDGRVESFVTAMTGELFDVLRKHSVLTPKLDAPSLHDPAAFADGLAAAGDGNALASRMFTARSRQVGGDMPPEQVTSYLSGLLVGAEAASVPALFGVTRATPVSLIGNPSLCERYEEALQLQGFTVTKFDGDGAALAGLKALSA